MKFLVGIVVLILLAGAGVWVLQMNTQQSPLSDQVTSITPTSPPQTTGTTIQSVPSDWKLYTSDAFSVAYPPTMQVSDDKINPVRFSIHGPSQSTGTEVYDGLIVTIDTGTFIQNTFQEFVEAERTKNENEPAISEVSETEQETHGNKPGYTFTIVGLGEFTQYYFPRGEKGYMHVSILLADPTNQGFSQIANTMLASLQ